MILLLGGGLPALAVAHFGFCSSTSNACRQAETLSHLLSREQHSTYRLFFSFHSVLKFWAVIVIYFFNWYIFLTLKEFVDRQWKEQKKSVKLKSQCICTVSLFKMIRGFIKTVMQKHEVAQSVTDRLYFEMNLLFVASSLYCLVCESPKGKWK